MVELRLPYGFSIECDALYKRLGFGETTKMSGLIFTYTNASANSWEFPLLAKYRLPSVAAARPYFSAGPSFRARSGVSVSSTRVLYFGGGTVTGPLHTSNDIHFDNRSNLGFTIGFGIAARLKFLYLAPEARYTRWKPDRQTDPFLHSYQNQVELLLGITF
jgi:hypothetical protein